MVEIDFSGGIPNYDIVAFSATNTGTGLLPDPNYQWVGLDCVDGDGEWDFEITDANGCSLDTSITISCIDPLVLQATAENITCFSYGDGLIEGSMSGGTGALTLTGSPNLGADIIGEGSVDFEVTNLQAA